MELVYLWVEEYKNIYRQGFNFSPRFRCKYDPDTNELSINENDDYIENFFGDNINVTAIVGKNGSGKSSIIKLVYLVFYLHFYRKIKTGFLDEGEKLVFSIANILMAFKSLNMFLLIYNNESLYKIDINFLKNYLLTHGDFEFQSYGLTASFRENQVKYNYNEIENFNDNIDIFSIYYNNSLDVLKENETEEWIELLYHRQDNYQSPLLIEPAKYDNKINISLLRNISNQRVLLFYEKIKDNKLANITTFFNPTSIKFQYALGTFDLDIYNDVHQSTESKFDGGSKFDTNILGKIKKQPFKIILKYLYWAKEYKKDINYKFIQNIYSLYDSNDYIKLNTLYIAFKTIEKNTYFQDDLIKSLHDAIESEDIEKIEETITSNIDNFFKSTSHSTNNHNIKKIYVAIQFLQKHYHTIFESYKDRQIPIRELPNDILSVFPAWIYVEILENEKSLSSLSTGEKFKFFFIISLLYQLRNLSSTDHSSINLYLDEVEMGFHPEWQKSFLNELLFALKNYNKPINLYFLTHSPFLLSDIPKQNIIFLDIGENGNCKVVDGLHEKKETFGANIHTLLSDSFFMEDGLMGEFAKGKINEIIKFHKIVEKGKHQECLKKIYDSKQKEFWQTQSIIGEDYLKQIIKNHLIEIEKILLGKDAAKQAEIERTESYLERLKNA